MLGFLQGKLVAKNAETQQGVLLVGGVGYEVSLPKRIFETLETEQTVSLWIHTHVREDLLVLYGFGTEAEKQFFRILLGVSGLGPKTALSLLTEHGAERLTQHILAKDIDEISHAPGVGKKLAQRLVLELGSKLEKLAWVTQLEKVSAENKVTAPPPGRQLRDDLSSALLNLGYQPNQVKTILDKVLAREAEERQGFEACLRSALKELSGRASRELGNG